MKKKYLLYIILIAFLAILTLNTKCFAANLDEIVNYIVTVEPRMNDGSLDITYEITWKVLDSTTEGPLTWVQIGTPNSNFDAPTALTKNIKSIRAYSGSYVRIDFDKAYYAGQSITFKYKIHQSYMYIISGSKCNYAFTPAWFTNARVDSLTVLWNADQVKSSNSSSKEDNYLIWNKTNMSNGAKLNTKVEYNKSAFSSLNENKQSSNFDTNNYYSQIRSFISVLIIIVVAICIISALTGGRRRRLL